MTSFEKFIKSNNVLKKDIAKYLGISNAFVTQLCDGSRSIPNDKVALLKQNPYGWDTTMLEQSPTINTRVSGNGSANVQVGSNNKLVQDSSDLKVQIAVLEKENELLREQRELLLEQNDFLKTLLNK